MRIITYGGRPVFPVASGRRSRASSVPMSRSAATILFLNTSTTSPVMASSNRSMCRPIGRRSGSRTRRPGCSARHRIPAGGMRSSLTRISARTTCARNSTGSSATRWCVACACSCTGIRIRSIASPRAAICAPIRRSAATSRGWRITAGASSCRCSRRRCRTRLAWPKPVRTSPSCCSTPECWKTCPLPAVRNGAPAWCGWRPVRTSSASSRGSAPSFTATTPRTSPVSLPIPWRSSAPIAAWSARTFRSRSCGPAIAISSRPMSSPSNQTRLSATRSCARQQCGSIVSRPSPARENKTRNGRQNMALEIKILDYGDIELESSFLVLGRDCGRTRRVLTLGFLITGGAYPIVVDTGYRSNQIMETLGMRGLQFHENMIENQLSRHGVRMGDVRFVLHTHLHIDHAGKDDLFPMNTTVVLNRKELEYSVSGLMHPQYPAPDIKHLIDRLHTKSALRFLDLEITGAVELIPGVYCEAAGAHTEGSMNMHVHTAEGIATICGDVLYDINDQLVEPFREIHDAEPRTTGNHGTSKRAEKASIKKLVNSSRFLLPVHDRPCKVEGGYVVGRLQDQVPGPIVQSLPKRNWFPA